MYTIGEFGAKTGFSTRTLRSMKNLGFFIQAKEMKTVIVYTAWKNSPPYNVSSH